MDPFAMNSLLSEILNVINGRDEPYDCDSLVNLERAVRSQWLNYFIATGGPNDIAITPATAFADLAHLVGVPLRIKVGAVSNTGPMTLNVGGLGAIAITTMTNAALSAGAVLGNAIVEVMYDGVAFRLHYGGAGSQDAAGRPTQQALYAHAKCAGSCVLVNNVQTLVNDWVIDDAFLGGATMVGGQLTFDAASAGVWFVSASVGIATPTNNWTNKLQLTKIPSVGPAVTFGYSEMGNFGTNLGGNLTVSGVIRVAAGDLIRVLDTQNTGANQNTNSSFNFYSACRIGF